MYLIFSLEKIKSDFQAVYHSTKMYTYLYIKLVVNKSKFSPPTKIRKTGKVELRSFFILMYLIFL